MIKENLKFSGVYLLKPKIHKDKRGSFHELFQKNIFLELGIKGPWFQDNLSFTNQGVVRGLHFQHPKGQGKLITVISGSVFDVVVDIRVGSPTFGQWIGLELNEENAFQLWIPIGFAHGFQALSSKAYVHYKCSHSFWSPENEKTISCIDPFVNIKWPSKITLINFKDQKAPNLQDIVNLPKFDEFNE